MAKGAVAQKMPDFIPDEQVSQYEATAPDFISDEDMAKMPQEQVGVSLDYNPPEEKGFFGGMAETIIPDLETLKGLVMAGLDPAAAIRLGKDILGSQKEQFVKAGEAFGQGENVEGVGRVAAGMLPLVGPAAAQAGERIGQGEVARGLGNAAGMLAPFAARPALRGASQVAGKASGLLKESAVRQYSKVLGPTTKENKLITERVVPELLNRKVRALSRSGLQSKAEASAASANDALDAAYAALPQGAEVEFGPVLRQIQKAKDNLVVKGTDEVVREDLYRALDKVQQKVLKIAGGTDELSSVAPKVSVATARSARQQLDAAVASKTKIFAKTGKETLRLAAEKEGGNAIRAELAHEFPDVAAINKEVNLWLNVKSVLGDTLTRTASQATPLGERIVTAGGMAGGLTRGLKSAVGYAAGLKMLSKLINSTAWRTVSAVEKNRLADLLGSGRVGSAEIYAKGLGTAARGGSEPPLSGGGGGGLTPSSFVGNTARRGYPPNEPPPTVTTASVIPRLPNGGGPGGNAGSGTGNQAFRGRPLQRALPEQAPAAAPTAPAEVKVSIADFSKSLADAGERSRGEAANEIIGQLGEKALGQPKKAGNLKGTPMFPDEPEPGLFGSVATGQQTLQPLPAAAQAKPLKSQRSVRKTDPIREEALGILDSLAQKYQDGLPTKTNEIIFSELDSSGAGQGRGKRNYTGMNVNDIPILQDVPHSDEAIVNALNTRKGKIWNRILQEADDYVRRYKEEERLAGELGDDVPF